MSARVLHGDCVELMADMDAESVDAVVCDPPYDLIFMGKTWDGTGVAFRPVTWEAAMRVLKPGGHLLAFGGSRTSHRMVCAIEDAGFEIRDSIMWLYGSGFPKSLNVEKAIVAAGLEDRAVEGRGLGTALKPGHEPICVARKPLTGTVAANVLEHGTGALNIDGCRLEVTCGLEEFEHNHAGDRGFAGTRSIEQRGDTHLRQGGGTASGLGRWPANVVLDPEAAFELDEQSGQLVSGANPTRRSGDRFREVYGVFEGQRDAIAHRGQDAGGASRFFYCAKPSGAERTAGLDAREPQKKPTWSSGEANPGTFQSEGTSEVSRNPHPTVKPVELMRWLIRLITPPGGLVLDPFCGSGTTGCAAALENVSFLGLEAEAEYVSLAQDRIAWWTEHGAQEHEAQAGNAAEVLERAAKKARRALAEHPGLMDLFGGQR